MRDLASRSAAHVPPPGRALLSSLGPVAAGLGLAALLHEWRGETILVAAFDPMALSSLVLACHEPGPRLMLVEDVTPLSDLRAATPVSAFHGKGWKGAFGQITLAELIKRANRQGVHIFPGVAAAGHAPTPA